MELFTRLNLARYVLNSALLSIAVTFISLLVNSRAGFAFAKYRFAGRDRIFKLLISSMVIPSQVTMLPLFLMLNRLGLVNTYFGVIIPGMASIFGIFLIRQYALSIPDSLLEAARMDVASDFRIYRSVVLPLCRPILVTLGVFTFMGTWNDFLWPLIVGIGARNLTIASDEVRCPIIHISSDYVFDGGKETPYDEWDRPNPINHYGISKLLAEQFVSSMTNKYYIVRTSWLYGPNGKNFVDTFLRLLAETKELRVVNDQFGSPTFTEDLAAAIRQLIGKGYGIYHVTNSGVCSWHEFALKIAELKEMQKPIIPVTSAEFKRPARRPTHSAMNNTMLRLEGIPALRHWSEGLEQYMKQSY